MCKNCIINWYDDIVFPAIRSLYESCIDRDLLKRDVSERSIAAVLFCRMKKALEKQQQRNPQLRGLSIDFEYNRNFEDSKRIYSKCSKCKNEQCINKIKDQNSSFDVPPYVTPDIIIHHRGTNRNNQVIIEIKKESNSNCNDREKDKSKLIYFTCQESLGVHEELDYKFSIGYFLDLGFDHCKITPYVNGKQQNVIVERFCAESNQ